MRNLLFALLIMLLPMVTMADDCGFCGGNLEYTFVTSTGTLTISGTGNMEWYNSYSDIPWYSYRSSIINVEISEGVTSIGRYAFYECIGLTSITIPQSATYIDNYAFGGCSSLTSITIPESVTSMGFYPFNGCTSLPVEGNVRYADKWAVGVDNFSLSTYTLRNDTKGLVNTFNSCSNLTSINIPESVTYIGVSAFYNCSSLTSITIPESVTDIEQYAFSGCTSLPVESHVRYADKWAVGVDDTSLSTYTLRNDTKGLVYTFEECDKLTSITIPEGVTYIGARAFYDCNNLTSITIPEGVTYIGALAFYFCNNLTSITIPESVTSIGEGAFKNCSALTSIVIPEGVTSISAYAFWNCESLTSITIPENVTLIGDHAFADCESLTSITIPEGVTSIGQSAFSGSGLTSITIPEGVTSIEQYTFKCCFNLTSITIPEGVTSIGRSAFSSSGFTSITIPESVTSIDQDAFSGCTSLPVENNVRYADKWAVGVDDTSLSTYTLRNDTKGLANTFEGCSSLTSIAIPKSVTYIGEYAFAFCESLTSITIPEGVTSIGISAFRGCSSLSSITIPEGVTSIGYIAFQRCKNLTAITIPESVTYIGEDAFYGCSSLTMVNLNSQSVMDYGDLSSLFGHQVTCYNIGGNVIKIIDSAFYGYSKITSINIPDGVTSIGDYAFSNCKSLTSITIPRSVTSIGEGAFSDCAQMTHVELPEGLLAIEERTFDGCSSLSEISIPENVVSIGEGAFIGCGFTEIKIPAGVTTIAPNTFQQCKYLTKVTLPANVDTIGVSAFSSCSSLTNIIIPASVSYIDDSAFSSCGPLTLIVSEATTPPVAFWGTFIGNENAILVVPNGCKELYQAANGWSQFYAKNIQEMQIGDINYDGAIDKDDALVLVNKLAEGVQCGDQITLAADINSDNVVNVVDVVAAINALIDSGMIPYPMKTRALSNDYLSVEDFTIYAGETKEVEIYLDNTKGYTAFQADIHLPEGLVLAENASLGSRASVSHMLVTCLSNANVLRTVAFSLLAEDFNSNDGCLVKFAVTAKKNFTGGTLSIENVMFATSDEDGYVLSDVTATIMGDTGLYDFINEDNIIVEYYNLQGVRVDSPAQGIYIKKQGDRVSKVLFR